MKIAGTNILMILALIFTLGFTSCDEGTTVSIPGPDINFTFSYADASQQMSRSSVEGYLLVAKSDTIHGKEIESFLAGSGQDYTSVVEAATISEALLSIISDDSTNTINATFAGVDSIQIRYEIVGTGQDIVLAQSAVEGSDGKSMSFTDLKIDKSQAFELIKSDVIAKIYAVFDPRTVNCFQAGVAYSFTAKTTLSVKLSALTEGLISASE